MNRAWIRQSTAARLYAVDPTAIIYARKHGQVRTMLVFEGVRLIHRGDLERWRRSISPRKIRGRREPLPDVLAEIDDRDDG